MLNPNPADSRLVSEITLETRPLYLYRKECVMRKPPAGWLLPVVAALVVAGLAPSGTEAACCYFSAKNADILQPAQKVFITWDPVKKAESFTVQPKFEGNAQDFGMVIPTPAQPKLDEMPRDFFKELAVLTILKKREFPQSKLIYSNTRVLGGLGIPGPVAQ